MTEVPDYLLERSRQRRAALGLPGGGAPAGATGGAAPSPAASPGPSAAAPAASAATPAAVEPAPAGVGMPSGVAAAAGAPLPASLPVAHVESGPRTGIPVWMMPVLLILPFWGIIYMGAFAKPKAAAGPLTGAQIYVKAGCSGCHGPTGGGGVGPKLAGGEAKLTFPNEADHIAWVETGSAPSKGMLYGDPARPGGQHGPASGGMPAFKGQLTPEEIQAVVTYEREKL
ncbi:MAG TPA: cytochrome c [Acidimicrobiales bacterium]|nr:cytochrome c [Acidimicrobiales bacterium]